jgi:RNA polymerase sigma-70 factor (ECF subfamily)
MSTTVTERLGPEDPGHEDLGHEDFARLTEPLRAELLAHCYRMLGSVHDAEDQVQETLLRAWRSLDGFEGRASLRTWLYRIATNACLRALETRARRPLPSGLGGPASDPDGPFAGAAPEAAEITWLEPFPDARLPRGGPADPASIVAARADTRLALIAALQYLPPRQRAVLLLRDVLGWRAAEVAGLLGTSTAAVNSMLQRARAQLGDAAPARDQIREPADPRDRELVGRYAAAFADADVAGLMRLLTADAVFEMPPEPMWLAGRAAVGTFLGNRVLGNRVLGNRVLGHRVLGRRAPGHRVPGDLVPGDLVPGEPGRFRLVLAPANGQPGLATYLRGPDGAFHAEALQVLTTAGGRVTRITAFRDPGLFAVFGLPATAGG